MRGDNVAACGDGLILCTKYFTVYGKVRGVCRCSISLRREGWHIWGGILVFVGKVLRFEIRELLQYYLAAWMTGERVARHAVSVYAIFDRCVCGV